MTKITGKILVTITLLILIGTQVMVNETTTNVKANGTLNVVASLSIVADFASQIGLGLFVVPSIVSGTENPHIYEPTPSEIEQVASADLFIRFGLEDLEPWIDAVLLANPSVPVLNLVNSSLMRIDPLIETENPHVWLDPNIAKIFVGNIYDEIVNLDPSNTATYSSNRDNYFDELDDLLADISIAATEFSGLKVVVHHPAFMYLFDLLGIERVATIEEHEGEEPSAEHIAEVVRNIVAENVSMIVNQPQLEEEQIIEIARDTDILITELTPLLGIIDEKGYVVSTGLLIESYIDMIHFNLEALRNPYEPAAVNLNWSWWTLVGVGCVSIFGTIITVFVVRSKKPSDILKIEKRRIKQ
ncbi:MAG: zinc ABC transporter substrate-binding protein [Candidatus Heimdallarchaeota archaeon]|nr:zinc ABC transporter substrate-binding protein [Candidatus Heimdallarchaeota archaeon]MBY8993093.1 zinc ABC transporter substrate-binding protein [Candidatus Heimdallarchaeota archaeon]